MNLEIYRFHFSSWCMFWIQPHWSLPRHHHIYHHGNLRLPPNAHPFSRTKALARDYEGIILVSTPLIKPYFLGGVALRGYPSIPMISDSRTDISGNLPCYFSQRCCPYVWPPISSRAPFYGVYLQWIIVPFYGFKSSKGWWSSTHGAIKKPLVFMQGSRIGSCI